MFLSPRKGGVHYGLSPSISDIIDCVLGTHQFSNQNVFSSCSLYRFEGRGGGSRENILSVQVEIFTNLKMTGGSPEVRSDKSLSLLTFDIRYLAFDN